MYQLQKVIAVRLEKADFITLCNVLSGLRIQTRFLIGKKHESDFSLDVCSGIVLNIQYLEKFLLKYGTAVFDDCVANTIKADGMKKIVTRLADFLQLRGRPTLVGMCRKLDALTHKHRLRHFRQLQMDARAQAGMAYLQADPLVRRDSVTSNLMPMDSLNESDKDVMNYILFGFASLRKSLRVSFCHERLRDLIHDVAMPHSEKILTLLTDPFFARHCKKQLEIRHTIVIDNVETSHSGVILFLSRKNDAQSMVSMMAEKYPFRLLLMTMSESLNEAELMYILGYHVDEDHLSIAHVFARDHPSSFVSMLLTHELNDNVIDEVLDIKDFFGTSVEHVLATKHKPYYNWLMTNRYRRELGIEI